jgi:hypothetical protein
MKEEDSKLIEEKLKLGRIALKERKRSMRSMGSATIMEA